MAWGAGEAFRIYLLRNREVTFRCNDIRFHVKIEGVEVYTQGFAAVAIPGTVLYQLQLLLLYDYISASQ